MKKLPQRILLFSFFCLTSCIDLKISIQLTAESAGTINLDAFLYRSSQQLQLQEDNSKLVPTLPSTREEWTKLLQTVPGSNLLSFDSRSETLGTAITTVVSFSNAQVLEKLFFLFQQKASLTVNGRTWNLTLAWLSPRFTQMSQRNKSLWNALWGEKEWELILLAPRTIRLISGNGQVKDNQAVWKMKLSSLTVNPPPEEWKLSW